TNQFFNRLPNSYIYVSNANVHKNHSTLIEAFCMFYDEFGLGVLTLTVDKSFSAVYELIKLKKAQGYPINNIGFVNRNFLEEQYKKHQYLIYPSLSESFGLGLVEAIENGCKV